MKEKWFINLIKEARQTRLTRAEKQTMLSAILGGPVNVPSPYQFALVSFIRTYHRQAIAFATVFALVVTTGGTSFAAASALPGEALYVIKVNVNEELQSFVALSPDAKARVGIARTTNRLKEAEKLAEEGLLTPEAQTIIKDKIKEHGEDIKANLAVLASTNATVTAQAVVSDFKASVEAAAPTPAPAEEVSADLAVVSAVLTEDAPLEKSAIDVEADAQALGLLSITEELKAEIVVIESNLASSSAPTVDVSASSTASSTLPTTLPEVPVIPETNATVTAQAILRVQ